MYVKCIIKIMIVLIVLNSAGIALCFEQNDIQMHGFASQGYLKSTENDYLGNSKEGSWEFNEVGVNFAIPISDELRFGIQFFSRDLGTHGNNKLLVDWAFMDYTFQDWLGFRAGKIKTPLGLYNRQRDADILRTSILLDQSVYSEAMRDFVVAFQGISFYGSCPMGIVGDLDYEVFGGKIDISTDTSFEGGVSKMVPVEYMALIGPDTITSISVSQMTGGMLVWNMPVPGLRVSGTFLLGTGDIGMDIGLGPMAVDISLNNISVLSTEYEIGPAIFAVEYLMMDIDFDSELITIPLELAGGYGRVSWRILDWLSLGASYGEFYPHPDDKNGNDYIGTPMPTALAWHKDAGVSVRFDIVEKWSLKLETHFINGLAQVSGTDYSAMKEDWILVAAKTSLSF